MRPFLKYPFSFLLLLAGIFACNNISRPKDVKIGSSFSNRNIKCVIDVARYDDSTKVLITGYNYALLKDFARDMDSGIEIIIPDEGENYPDSLRNGDVDLIAIPYRHGNHTRWETTTASNPVDDLTVWMLEENNLIGLMEVNHWLDTYHKSNLFKKYHRLFVHTFHDPFKEAELGVIRSEISPYDSLFRVYARQIGWEWRLLAALSFKESKFRIDARSHKGATGLMQMVPVTADRFALEDLLDPEENIKTGANYISWLKKVFSQRMPEDSEDMKYFILASYNCGEGHIIDCINHAKERNIYDGTWSSVRQIFPEMAQDNISEIDSTVKLGKFGSGPVLNYVDEILSIKEIFDEICPD